jgi:protein NrfD
MSEHAIPLKEQEVVEETKLPPPKKFVWRPEYLPWILAVIGLVVGGIGLYQRFAYELRLTDLGSFVPWGLWVATYEYLVWLEVGSLTIYTLLVYVFKMNSALHKMARTLYLTALAILAMALILIGLDLGHPFRFWHVFIYPQWGSLMTWMIWLHLVYLVVLLAKLIVETRPQTPGVRNLATWLAYISLPLGVALVVVAGSVFGVVLGRPTWQGSALPVYFLLSALVAGAALFTFQFVWFYPGKRDTDHVATAIFLGKILLGMLIVGLIAAALIGLVILYPGVPAQATALQLTLFGPFWWVYWVFHIGLGVIVPIALLLTKTKAARRVGVAAGLFILTFIAVPLNIVIPPQLAIEVVEKNLVIAYQGPGLAASYFPTLSEWLVTLFALAFGALVFLVGYHILWLRFSNNPAKEG